MSRVTVLMAVYNGEQYVGKALNSLMRQTLGDIQIVCIDDASTDATMSILNDYARLDKRIRVVHLDENHGQAYARNEGLKIADGEFITMLDADDWLADDSLQQAVDVFEAWPQTDSVLYDVRIVDPDGEERGYDWHFKADGSMVLPDGSFDVMSGNKAFLASLDWGIHGVTMDRASLFMKYPYDTTCRFYSDDNTVRLHYLASREVRCSKAKYYYFNHPSSVSHLVGIGRMDWMRAADSMRRQLSLLKVSDIVMRIWEWERWKIIVGCYWFTFLHRHELTAADRRYCLAEIRKAWQGVDMPRLKGKPIFKPGWYPFPRHWMLFKIEETLYFRLRRLIGRR